MSKLKITYVRSAIHCPVTHKRVIESLGLRKLNQTVEQPDNPAIRGMVRKVNYLLCVEEINE
jgi:large subunit ribosomal protein L30